MNEDIIHFMNNIDFENTDEVYNIIYKLEHNWNELKNWLIKKMNEYVTYQGDLSSIYEEVFDKAVELEEGGNNDC